MPENESQLPRKEQTLPAEERELIRDFLWKSVVPPAILVSILTAIGGYVFRGVQDSHFLTQLEDKVFKFSESTGNASGRLEIAQRQADDFLSRIRTQDEQAQKLAAELKGIEAYAQSKEDRAAIIAALANDGSFKGELVAKIIRTSWDPAKQSGSLQLGDTLICYGTAVLEHRGSRHTYGFDFPFPNEREFAAPPAISQSVRTKSNGETYAVFNYTLTTAAYSGVLNEAQGRDDDNPVTMSYVAIGKAK